MVMTTLYALSCLGIGSILFYLLRVRVNLPVVAVVAAAFTLGQGMLAVFFTIISFVGLFSSTLILGCMVAGLIGLIFLPRISNLSNFRHELQTTYVQARALNIFWQILILLIFILIAITSFNVFMYPTWDAVAAYLYLPKLLAYTERFSPFLEKDSFIALTVLSEFHSAALMSIADVTSARLFMWWAGCAFWVVSLALGGKVGLGLKGQILLLAMLTTTTSITNLIGDGKVDMAGFALAICAYLWVILDEDDWSMLVIAALFLGLAVLAKLTFALTLAIPIILLLIWQVFLKNNLRFNMRFIVGSVRVLVPFGIISGGIFSLFFIKNGILYDDILAGFLLAGEKWITPEVEAYALRNFPLVLTFGDGNGDLYGRLSSLPLAFFPLVIFIPTNQNFLKSRKFQLAIVAVVGILLWMILGSSPMVIRYMLPSFVILFIVVGFAAENFLENVPNNPVKPLILLFTLVVVLSSIYLIFDTTWFFVRERLTTREIDPCIAYPASPDPTDTLCEAFFVVNGAAQSDDHVYLYTYARFWLDAPLLETASIDLYEVITGPEPDPTEWWQKLYNDGYRFAIVDRLYIDLDLFPDIFDVHTVPSNLIVNTLYDDPRAVVYEIREGVSAENLPRP